MGTLDALRRPVAPLLSEFDDFIDRQFTAEGELLSEMLRYALSVRGKGIRPLLVFLSAALHGGGAERVGRRAHLAAMLVEMIHVASLIHDDVIDGADQRRGHPSPNALWQSRNAVVLGDYVLARTMQIGLESDAADLVTHVVRTMGRLCEGEVLQSDAVRRRMVSRARYFEVIRRKTASLLGVSASVGALAVGAGDEVAARMAQFGETLGMAFQIKDDLLDYAEEGSTGKPAHNDLREGKITLPLLVLLEEAPEERRAGLLALLDRCASDPEAVARLHDEVVRGGGMEQTERVMREFADGARQLLADFPASPCRESLEGLCRYVTDRTR